MNILVTGGAGFIGRWVVKMLLKDGHKVVCVDDLSNGSLENIKEFKNKGFIFVKGDIKDKRLLEDIFKEKYDIIYHLAASINVQESIDNPSKVFDNDVVGTFNILEYARRQMYGRNGRMDGDEWIIDKRECLHPCKIVFMSTCMVYDAASLGDIDESHPVKPSSPYAASKLAAENIVLSYFNAFKLPVVILRPFNTYGPFQKTNGEGGVVSIFISKVLAGKDINIYGTGNQTRDLLYVKDCARFVVLSGYCDNTSGEIINAGTGIDISINDLAKLISRNKVSIKHVKHIHPQSEIMKLRCKYTKAKRLVNWEPKYTLEEGIEETTQWIYENNSLKGGE